MPAPFYYGTQYKGGASSGRIATGAGPSYLQSQVQKLLAEANAKASAARAAKLKAAKEKAAANVAATPPAPDYLAGPIPNYLGGSSGGNPVSNQQGPARSGLGPVF